MYLCSYYFRIGTQHFYDGRMGDFGLHGAARAGSAELHAVPARAWEEAAACRKGGGAVLTRMGTGFTSVLMLPAWLLRKLSAVELAQLLDDPGSGGRAAAPAAAVPAVPKAAAAPMPTPRQLARRQRRKRQRERRRAACGADAAGALASDDVPGGGACDAPVASSSTRPAGGSARSTGSAPSAALALRLPSQCDAVVCGGGTPAAAAPACAGPRQKRKRAGAGSVAGAREVCVQPAAAKAVLERVNALAESLREELVADGFSASQIRLRPLLLREGLLPQFPVVRGGRAEQAPADALTASVQSILRDTDVAPFEGLRRLVSEGVAAASVGSMSD